MTQEHQYDAHVMGQHIDVLKAEVKDLRSALHDHQQMQKASDLQLREIRSLVDMQSNDAGLWYISENASTSYIQQEFRKLHHLIEKHESSVICKTCGMPADTVVPGGDVIKHRCY